MATTRGQDIVLEVSATGGSAFTKVGFMRSKSLERQLETIDTTSDENPDWAATMAGSRSWSISGGSLFVYDNAGQELIEAAYSSNAAYSFRFSVGGGTYTGQAFVTGLTIEGSTNEVATYAITITGTGPLTVS